MRRELKKKAKPPREEKFPEHLERREVVLDVPDEQKECSQHGPKVLIGYDTTETLMFERPKLWVQVTKIPKLVCPDEPACGVAQPERPQGLVEGNRYDTSVAAEIVTAKFAFHLPYYRQQDWFAGCGWTPSRSTLMNITSATASVLEPLADYYRKLVVGSGAIGCDETRVTLVMPATIPAIDPLDPRSRRVHEVS